MAHSIIAGGTDYSEQSIWDIKEDIDNWIEYCERINDEFSQTIAELKENKYWETKVPYDFRSFCQCTRSICDTFCSDFQIITKAIETDNITRREIDLMKNIYRISREYEEWSWKSFKQKDCYWHDYGNPLFRKAEDLYAHGRDFFISMKDVSNAVCRMEDYMKDAKTTQTNIDNSINIQTGDNANFKKASFTAGQNERKEEQSLKRSFLQKFWWAIVVPIAVAVIAGVILFLLKMN